MATNFDTSGLQGLKDQANSASNTVADMTGSAPSMLNQLKSNLTTIFVKDNPFLTERNSALETFLNTPSQTRANLLPDKMPTVAGSALTLSPTQQNAITTASRNAALVPLAGLNQIVTGLYGNIPSMVQGAGTAYQAAIQAQQIKAEQARQNYSDAWTELIKKAEIEQNDRKFNEDVRQFNVQQKNKGSGTGTDAGLLAAIMAMQGMGGNKANPADFDGPDQAQAPQEQPYQFNINDYGPDPLANMGISSINRTPQAPGLLDWLFGQSSGNTAPQNNYSTASSMLSNGGGGLSIGGFK